MSRKENKTWSEIEPQLQTGDIILVHTKYNFISHLIRRKTRSYWNHTAMIFKDNSIIRLGSPLIIEAFTHGIEVHQLRKYTLNPAKYSIGVKRPTFLSEDQRVDMVKSFMLNNIDIPYDYLRIIVYMLTGSTKKSSRLLNKIRHQSVHEDLFICSTFIHKAFRSFVESGNILTTDNKPRDQRIATDEEITPGMIANDPSFTWIFNEKK